MATVLVRYDVDGWAFHRRAMGLWKYRPPGDQVTIASDEQYSNGKADGDYDAVFLCDMAAAFPGRRSGNSAGRVVRFVGSHAWMYNEYDPDDWRTKGVTPGERNAERAAAIVRNCDAVCVHNTEQKSFFDTIHPEVHLMPYPVDCQLFAPGSPRPSGRRLRIGWCGQLGGGEHNFKGFVEIAMPVIASFGERFVWKINHRDWRTALVGQDLADWYRSLDVFVCTSTAEGGPQTVFEAAACGAVVVSTDVGQVSDWEWLGENGLVVPPPINQRQANDTIDAIRERLIWLDERRTSLGRLRTGIVQSIRDDYDAAKLVPDHLGIITAG